MRHIALTAFLLVAVQAPAQQITISPKLREQDEFRLQLARTRENSARPQQNGASRTLVDVRVISATPQGFVLDWVPGETVFDNPQVAQDPLVTGASQALRDIRFRLNLNAKGEFAGLANQAEVMPRLQSVVDGIVQALLARIPVGQRAAFQGLIAQVLSPAVLIASATREPEMYFGLNGVALAAGEATEANIQLPNPLGGGELAAIFRVQMQSVMPDSASLKTTTAYDAATLQRLGQSLAQQAGASLTRDQLANLPPGKMDDEGRYLFGRTIGLMREVTVKRRVSIANMSRSDTWQIKLINGPKR